METEGVKFKIEEDDNELIQKIVEKINQKRKARGLYALDWNEYKDWQYFYYNDIAAQPSQAFRYWGNAEGYVWSDVPEVDPIKHFGIQKDAPNKTESRPANRFKLDMRVYMVTVHPEPMLYIGKPVLCTWDKKSVGWQYRLKLSDGKITDLIPEIQLSGTVEEAVEKANENLKEWKDDFNKKYEEFEHKLNLINTRQ